MSKSKVQAEATDSRRDNPWYVVYSPYTDHFQATYTPLHEKYIGRWKELTVIKNGPTTAYFTPEGDIIAVEVNKIWPEPTNKPKGK